MIKIPYSKFLYSLFLLAIALNSQAAEIQVAVDRNPVGLNESFQIIFTAQEDPDGAPDFSALEDNFEILNQQRSSNASWVNGKSSRTERWIVQVMAKQAGELLIPPIAFGSDSSKPLSIKVSDSPQTVKSSDELFLEVQATPEQPYVQAQVLYTLKLYRRVQITQASLNEPEVKDALVEKLGEDSTYTTQINGVDYWITERKYAIFPQQSGVVTIAPLTLTAEVVSNQRPSFNGFFNRQVTETRRISSKAITLTVLPVPQQFAASAWLNAESLTLKESWSDNSLRTRVGEPLTRTITLTAKGATVGQLPELATAVNIDGLKTYPDQPVLNEQKDGDGITALREEKIAYIPGKAGKFSLPAIRIDWFNSKTGKMDSSVLPAVTLEAQAAANASTPVAPDQTDSGALPDKTTITTTEVATPLSIGLWQGLAAFFGLGWLLTALAWVYTRRKQPSPVNPQPVLAESTIESTSKPLKVACLTNDSTAARAALLLWGKKHFGVDSLSALARHCTSPLAEEIERLNRLSYSGQEAGWQGQALWQAFAAQKTSRKQSTTSDDALESLYRF